MKQAGWRLAVKRAFDKVTSGALLVATAPVMAGTAVAVALSMGRPVLFRQPRPGRGGRVFKVFKFRTMSQARGEDGELLPDGQRLTRVGKLLRRTSLDELPQLLNVWRGDMSLVGPRPLLVAYLERYSPRQARRHEVLPGITGLTAVRGRNTLSWDEKFELDVRYVDEWSLRLDARILAETALALLRNDVSYGDHATMPEFRGSSPRPPPPTNG